MKPVLIVWVCRKISDSKTSSLPLLQIAAQIVTTATLKSALLVAKHISTIMAHVYHHAPLAHTKMVPIVWVCWGEVRVKLQLFNFFL